MWQILILEKQWIRAYILKNLLVKYWSTLNSIFKDKNLLKKKVLGSLFAYRLHILYKLCTCCINHYTSLNWRSGSLSIRITVSVQYITQLKCCANKETVMRKSMISCQRRGITVSSPQWPSAVNTDQFCRCNDCLFGIWETEWTADYLWTTSWRSHVVSALSVKFVKA